MDAPATFLVFGDLHGRILPAFRFGAYWAARTGRALAGLLQVGDMGYYTDISHCDKATLRHAKDDPLELGALDVVVRTDIADRVFDAADSTFDLWFTAGNHEDFDELERFARASGDHQRDFAVDAYCRVRGIKDGAVQPFPCGLKVAAVWGVDGDGPNARQNLPPRGYIHERAVDPLTVEAFDVLLMHDGPPDAKRPGCGSELLQSLIELAQPRFAFFGHYGGDGSRIEKDFGRTEVCHLAGFELRTRDGHPERGSVGVLEWADGDGTFAFVDDADLKPFTRHNWKWA
jgi:ribosomal protein S18 acetylase RimI-like enzyme